MARKLKVFRTHLGFHDLIVAAPSKKAALEAWGAGPHLFSQGFAGVTDDPRLVKAALAKPGVVLKRQFGSTDEFREEPGKLRAPEPNVAEVAARKERDRRIAAQADLAARQVARARAREEAATAREGAATARDEQRAAKRRQREAAAAERARERAERAQEATQRHREREEAAAFAREDLRGKLQALMEERKQKLRDLERREDALATERRKVEESFETRSNAIRKQLRKL